MDFEDDSFDGAYAFEATCHANDPVKVYSEVCRVLKPGALFVDCAWALTDNYDENNQEHIKIKNDILVSSTVCLFLAYCFKVVLSQNFKCVKTTSSWQYLDRHSE